MVPDSGVVRAFCVCSVVTACRVAAQIVRLAVLEPGDNMIGGCNLLHNEMRKMIASVLLS